MTANPNPEPSHQREPATGHETRDANVRWIARVLVFLFVSGLAIQFILSGLLSNLKHTPPPTDRWRPRAYAEHVPPSAPQFPRLQVSPPLDLLAFRAREEAELNTYGWVNRTSGVVRIPIERAMELVLQEGLPVRANPNANRLGPSTYQLMQQRPEHRQPEIKGNQ
ncbi:MAG: hypothetical protein ACREIC_11435 [Limisphaerales bacterium]